MIVDDCGAYLEYPQYKLWFNKLWVAELFGHDCGPCGTAPSKDGVYIVRPIYNLSGMGVGSHVKVIEADDCTAVPPGYFWCEYLHGKHYSVNYEWGSDRDISDRGGLQPWRATACWEGLNTPDNLIQFTEWKRSSYIPHAPDELAVIRDVKNLNVEFKGCKVIEVHLRNSPDPDYDHIVPIWQDTDPNTRHWYMWQGYTFVDSYEDADGYLNIPRLGFMVK
jgi:hypothetical protein